MGKANNGSFKKGKSGNPGGRKKVAPEFKAACEKLAPEALATIAEIMECGDNANRLAASKFIIEQVYGRAPQAIELSGPEGGPIQTATELIDRPPRETLEEWQARRKKELEKK